MGKLTKSVSKSVVKSLSKSSLSHVKSKPKRVKSYKLKLTKGAKSKLLNTTGSKLTKHSKYVSRTECYIALYLSFYYQVIQQYKVKGVRHVFDIYLPKYNLVIEYDGSKWHKDKSHDRDIDKLAASKGLKMLRIPEDEYYKHGKLKYVQKLIGMIDISILTKHLTSSQKLLLNDFWK